jgi:isopenicillin N synthase-like dioxygenase
MTRSETSPHTAFTELPVVDISGLFSQTKTERIQTAGILDKAAREAGFFYLKGHGISAEIIRNLKAAAKGYFAQDIATKMQHYIGHSANHTGYVPQGEEQFYNDQGEAGTPDLKEAYDIGPDTPSLMARFVSEASTQWPQSALFQSAVRTYYAAMLDLSRTLFKGFALALGEAEDCFTRHLTQPPSQLRLIHYFDNPKASDDDSGIGAHTDYEFFTILLPTAPGLQVLNGANQWIDVPLLDNCFVINIGDMMELVSNGRYVATSHRVRKVREERYAFPFFSSLDYATQVAPISALADNDSASHYSPLICGDHLLKQTLQTFRYLKQRLATGEICCPEEELKPQHAAFGRLSKTSGQLSAKEA